MAADDADCRRKPVVDDDAVNDVALAKAWVTFNSLDEFNGVVATAVATKGAVTAVCSSVAGVTTGFVDEVISFEAVPDTDGDSDGIVGANTVFNKIVIRPVDTEYLTLYITSLKLFETTVFSIPTL
jgi:hypothetical protein